MRKFLKMAAAAAIAAGWYMPGAAQSAELERSPRSDRAAKTANAELFAPHDGIQSESTSPERVLKVINWVIATRDNHGLPFIVIDKAAAEVLVFNRSGQLLGVTPALLGSAPGDESVPGIGERDLSDILPEERTTPAGRFVAKFGPAKGQKTVLWVDFNSALSLHPVATGNRREHRLERLRTLSPDDNRITYGCINVPKDFYDEVVSEHFSETPSVVYILPEFKDLVAAFPSFQSRKARNWIGGERTIRAYYDRGRTSE